MPKATSFEFTHKSASATVSVREDMVCYVYNVMSDKRRKGHGTGLLKKITRWADKHGYILKLTADAFGEDSFKKNKELAAFYRSFGFVDDKNPPIHLKRKPH